ncbi:hypothetical protein IFVP177_C140062 [Vibrio parahaemolyticus]
MAPFFLSRLSQFELRKKDATMSRPLSFAPYAYSRRVLRLPMSNRHITGQGHFRTPQKH